MNSIAQSELSALANDINREHTEVEQALRSAVGHAIKAGELLIKAKGKVEHGQWLPWLKTNCWLSERTAQAYMKLAREYPKLDPAKAQRVADLPIREAIAELSESKGHKNVSSRFVPKPGQALMLYTGGDEEINDWGIVEPSIHDGFYYVSVFLTDSDGNGGMVFGTKKPCRSDYIEDALKQWMSLHDVTIVSGELEPREYNSWLFTSYEQYRNECILGRKH